MTQDRVVRSLLIVVLALGRATLAPLLLGWLGMAGKTLLPGRGADLGVEDASTATLMRPSLRRKCVVPASGVAEC
jgi:hypothetical protein